MRGLGLLLVDLQDVFLGTLPDRERLEKRLCFITEASRLLDLPIYLSEQVPEKLGNTIPALTKLAEGSFVFSKDSFSAWESVEFQDRLREDDIQHLLVAGIETPICIYQTLIHARKDDMSVTLLSDAISGRREEDAPFVVRTLIDHGVLVLPSESVFYSILKDTSHPKFREFTKLVKKYS